MDNLVLVNNNHSINKNYVPNDLESCDQGINLQFYYYSLLRKEANLHFLKL